MSLKGFLLKASKSTLDDNKRPLLTDKRSDHQFNHTYENTVVYYFFSLRQKYSNNHTL